MLRSDFCGYSDAYFVMKGKITVESNNDNNRMNKKLVFKKNTPLLSCIPNVNNIFPTIHIFVRINFFPEQ